LMTSSFPSRAKTSCRSDCEPGLPSQSNSEPHLPLAAILRAGDSGEAVQIAHCSIRVQTQVRDIAAGVAEPPAAGDVECLHADLHARGPSQLKLPEDAEIPRCDAGAA